jgi:hypothetical protein
MKFVYATIGLAGALLAGSAHATPGPGVLPGSALFSSFVTNAYDSNSVALHAPSAITPTQGGSPAAQEFFAPSATTITDMVFRLSDSAPTPGGSLLVYLVQNGTGNFPSSSGISLTNDVLLGSILDSSLTSTASNVLFTPSIAGSGTITAPGDYWIALVGTSTSDQAVWWRAGDTIGLNVGNTGNSTAGLYNSHVVPSGTSMTSVNTNSFELQINTPEPASLALLGAGMAGLGIIRRRQNKKATSSLPNA